MNRALLVFALIILIGCNDKPTPEESEDSSTQRKRITPTDTFLINYNHGDGANSVSATASNLDGVYKVTVTRNGKDITKALDGPSFRSLWDGIIDIPDIANSSVSDPNVAMDFRTHHIIGVVYSTGGQQGLRTFAVPASAQSPEFQSWVTSLTGP